MLILLRERIEYDGKPIYTESAPYFNPSSILSNVPPGHNNSGFFINSFTFYKPILIKLKKNSRINLNKLEFLFFYNYNGFTFIRPV